MIRLALGCDWETSERKWRGCKQTRRQTARVARIASHVKTSQTTETYLSRLWFANVVVAKRKRGKAKRRNGEAMARR